MKKIITFIAIAFMTVNLSAQESKTVTKEKAKKESCCAKKDSNAKTMTAAEVAKCKAKCKAEGKTCKTAC
ncbi:hypothetical protein [Flavobacterium caseinilyticum]|uniref:Uncharacterized protein n=1 Tax=Flavobacterium caseinilyticum TaxID=2541732 RepID=A0A4V2YTU5_9FLAO|nr:hypothetical protein [Flavobacterium caseinilyticum]TDD75177.1 hypothetical protein E0F89_12395 [Flavobacterium caseinilyticum]